MERLDWGSRGIFCAERRGVAFYAPFIKDGAYSVIDEDRLDEYLPDFKSRRGSQPREYQVVQIGGLDHRVEKPMLWSWSGYPRAATIKQTLRIEIDHAPRRGPGGK